MAELTDKQQAFVDHYVACLNGAKAARLAGYAESGARVEAHRLLTNANIRAAIDARLADAAMPASEVLARLTDQARSSMGEFVGVRGRGLGLDLKAARERGVLHLVKKYSKTKQGETIELYDAQSALVQLGKHYGLWTADDDDWQQALAKLGYNAADFFGQLVERLAPTASESAE